MKWLRSPTIKDFTYRYETLPYSNFPELPPRLDRPLRKKPRL